MTALLVLASASAQAARGADGEYDERESSHFVLFQDVDIDQTSGFYGSRRYEQRVLEVLEEAFRLLEDQLAIRVEGKITVTIHDPKIFDARFGGLFRFPLAGFYGGSIHVRGGAVLDNRLIKTLHHEFVHAAFDRALPSRRLPAWFNEGVAEWFEARSIGQRRLVRWQLETLVRLAADDRLLGLDALSGGNFGHLGPEGAKLAYLQSFGLFEYLTRVYGDRPLRELCRRLIQTGDLDSAFRRAYRGSPSDLFDAFAADLRSLAY